MPLDMMRMIVFVFFTVVKMPGVVVTHGVLHGVCPPAERDLVFIASTVVLLSQTKV